MAANNYQLLRNIIEQIEQFIHIKELITAEDIREKT